MADKTDAGHESTWGASEAKKIKWQETKGKAVRKATEKANEERDNA